MRGLVQLVPLLVTPAGGVTLAVLTAFWAYRAGAAPNANKHTIAARIHLKPAKDCKFTNHPQYATTCGDYKRLPRFCASKL